MESDVHAQWRRVGGGGRGRGLDAYDVVSASPPPEAIFLPTDDDVAQAVTRNCFPPGDNLSMRARIALASGDANIDSAGLPRDRRWILCAYSRADFTGWGGSAEAADGHHALAEARSFILTPVTTGARHADGLLIFEKACFDYGRTSQGLQGCATLAPGDWETLATLVDGTDDAWIRPASGRYFVRVAFQAPASDVNGALVWRVQHSYSIADYDPGTPGDESSFNYLVTNLSPPEGGNNMVAVTIHAGSNQEVYYRRGPPLWSATIHPDSTVFFGNG